MTNEEPKVKPNGRYTARETCMLLAISQSTLNRQTKKGNITPMYHSSNMRRLYPGSEILKFYKATI